MEDEQPAIAERVDIADPLILGPYSSPRWARSKNQHFEPGGTTDER